MRATLFVEPDVIFCLQPAQTDQRRGEELFIEKGREARKIQRLKPEGLGTNKEGIDL